MRVGVIVAARAPVPWLAEALESVLAQVPPPDEVVVVDHGSEPPLELGVDRGLQRSADADRVRIVRIPAGGGPAVARQAGLDALDTDLIALADADDVWEEGKLAAQVAALAADPQAAVCFGRAVVIDAGGRATGEKLPELAAGRQTDVTAKLYPRNPIPAASAVIRREALEAVGGFIPEEPLPAATDWDLWLRLAASGCDFVCAPKARIKYRRHEGGLTSSVSRLAIAGLAIHERHAALVDEQTSLDARANDLETLARGRIRERRYDDAREALDGAATLRKPAARERLLRRAIAIPGLRALTGRRAPYPDPQ